MNRPVAIALAILTLFVLDWRLALLTLAVLPIGWNPWLVLAWVTSS